MLNLLKINNIEFKYIRVKIYKNKVKFLLSWYNFAFFPKLVNRILQKDDSIHEIKTTFPRPLGIVSPLSMIYVTLRYHKYGILF
jgi:hypothetical protein